VSDQEERGPSLHEDAALRAMVEGIEAETGDRFFSSLVRHLASALDVQYAFVSEIASDRESFRTLALWGRGAIVATLRRTGWRIDGPQGAARLLNMHPSTLRSRMQKLGIRRSASELS
jgi:transcriptional regulator with GAF, ATPase, and Fis domain